MASRRERAIKRAYDRDPINRESFDPLPWDELLLESYEIELAADLDQLAEVAWGNYSHPDDDASQEEEIAAIRAALKAALEER